MIKWVDGPLWFMNTLFHQVKACLQLSFLSISYRHAKVFNFQWVQMISTYPPLINHFYLFHFCLSNRPYSHQFWLDYISWRHLLSWGYLPVHFLLFFKFDFKYYPFFIWWFLVNCLKNPWTLLILYKLLKLHYCPLSKACWGFFLGLPRFLSDLGLIIGPGAFIMIELPFHHVFA